MGFSRQNTGVGCYFILQGIFPTQGLNPRLLHWQADSLPQAPTGKRKWQPSPVFLPGESREQRSLVGYCPWDRTVGHGWSDLACMYALEKEMATHSSVLAWRIPGTEEPGGLPSMGSQSQTQLKRLSSSSTNWEAPLTLYFIVIYSTYWACQCF